MNMYLSQWSSRGKQDSHWPNLGHLANPGWVPLEPMTKQVHRVRFPKEMWSEDSRRMAMRSGQLKQQIYAWGQPSVIPCAADLWEYGSYGNNSHSREPRPTAYRLGPGESVPFTTPAMFHSPTSLLGRQSPSFSLGCFSSSHAPFPCSHHVKGKSRTHLPPKFLIPRFLYTSPFYPRTSVIVSKIITKS